mgnify:CR=1 FL=1
MFIYFCKLIAAHFAGISYKYVINRKEYEKEFDDFGSCCSRSSYFLHRQEDCPQWGGKDSTDMAGYTTTEDSNVDLASVAGTYEGTFPSADSPGIKTVLTINADSTYQLQQDYIDRKNGHDEASGTFQVLDNNVLMLVRPSSGEHTFYKVKDANSIILTDSVGNEAEGETAKFYVLKKK